MVVEGTCGLENEGEMGIKGGRQVRWKREEGTEERREELKGAKQKDRKQRRSRERRKDGGGRGEGNCKEGVEGESGG